METGDVVAIIVACLTALGTIYTAVSSARSATVQRLTERVNALETENTGLHRENIQLREYIALLRNVLREHNIDVPPLSECGE